MSRGAPTVDGQQALSALELALRAARSGLTTCLIQLQPGREPYGEPALTGELPGSLNLFPALGGETAGTRGGAGRACQAAEGLELARLALACSRYDLVVLDEVAPALAAGYVTEDEIRGLTIAGSRTRLIAAGMPAGSNRTPASGSPGRPERRNHLTV